MEPWYSALLIRKSHHIMPEFHCQKSKNINLAFGHVVLYCTYTNTTVYTYNLVHALQPMHLNFSDRIRSNEQEDINFPRACRAKTRLHLAPRGIYRKLVGSIVLCWPIRLPCVIYGMTQTRSTFVHSELKLWPRAESPVVVYGKIVNGRRISVIYIYTATSTNWWLAEV